MNKISQRKALKWAAHQKRWFGKWHLYLGIFAGLILTVVGLTGSILVFQDEIDQALNKSLFEADKGLHEHDFGEIIPLIQKNYPDMKFDYLMRTRQFSGATYSLHLDKTDEEVFINPYTGKICGKRLHESNFIAVVTLIHRTLLIPVIGRYIVGLSALILLILTISGMRLWVPKKWKQLQAALTVKFSGSFKRQNYDWHNVFGIYTSPMVTLMALTGFTISFSILVVPLLLMLSGKSAQSVQNIFAAKSAYVKNAKRLSVAEIIRAANRVMPGAKVDFISFPHDSTGNYTLNLTSPGLPKSGKRELLLLDQYSGKPLINSRTDFPESGRAYLNWLTPVHYGSFGGLPTQILAVIGGLSPAVLFITGIIIWFPRWRKRKRKATEYIGEIPSVKPHVIVRKPFLQSLKSGFRYATITLVVTALLGVLYGLPSGIVMQPAILGIALSTIMVILNFVFSLMVVLGNIIFLSPFKRAKTNVFRYFAWSSAFAVTYTVVYMLLLNTGIRIF